MGPVKVVVQHCTYFFVISFMVGTLCDWHLHNQSDKQTFQICRVPNSTMVSLELPKGLHCSPPIFADPLVEPLIVITIVELSSWLIWVCGPHVRWSGLGHSDFLECTCEQAQVVAQELRQWIIEGWFALALENIQEGFCCKMGLHIVTLRH